MNDPWDEKRQPTVRPMTSDGRAHSDWSGRIRSNCSTDGWERHDAKEIHGADRNCGTVRMKAISMVGDRFGHRIDRGWGCSCLEGFDREIHHWPVVRVLWNFAISFGDFETRFLPESSKY